MAEPLALRFGLTSVDMQIVNQGNVIPEGYVVRDTDDSTGAVLIVRKGTEKIFDQNGISLIGFQRLINEARQQPTMELR